MNGSHVFEHQIIRGHIPDYWCNLRHVTHTLKPSIHQSRGNGCYLISANRLGVQTGRILVHDTDAITSLGLGGVILTSMLYQIKLVPRIFP
jgi:hypothetical protein